METAQDIGWGELDRLSATRIGRPTPVRDRKGRWHRDPAGEWDWFYGLPDADREYVQRHHMIDQGVRPDELATWLDTDVDDAMAQWFESVQLTRRSHLALLDPLSDEWAEITEDLAADVPVRETVLGLAEIADHLGVAQSTAHKWQARRLLPVPDMQVSRQPAWFQSTVDQWATETGRK